MRITRSIFAVGLALSLLTACGTTKTAVNNAVSEVKIITATDSIVPRKTDLTEVELQAWPADNIFQDSIPGMSLGKAYEFVKDKKSTPVIVGVIDSGIDIEHEDLKDDIWTNEDEIPGNGIDDDKNGYVDDIHGWNFLGGAQGQDVPEQLELTRIVKKWRPRFEGVSPDSVAEADKADYELYTKLTKLIDDKKSNAANMVTRFTMIKDIVNKANDTIKKSLDGKEYNLENVNAINFEDQNLAKGKMVVMQIMDAGESVDEAFGELDEAVAHYKNQLDSQYNVDFNGRLTSDDPYDITDTNYGNGFVIGSKDDEIHGTHVAGIIAATRNNGIGMNGVANNVKILTVRAVPDGDEYDKDIALAIRYAVDNGAKVINMSFGKSYSPNAQWVYDAIKYAASKDVLLVHAAGNDSADIDTEDNFPNDSSDKINEFSDNVITVGAMTRHFGADLVASFSNYGKKNVDIFAPGLEIYSTVPKDKYRFLQGTSMASPEVAGVAALVREYYPNLTASQVKHILMDSGIEFKGEVILPGGSDTDMVPFDNLSVSGRIVNAYNALLLADKISRSKK